MRDTPCPSVCIFLSIKLPEIFIPPRNRHGLFRQNLVRLGVFQPLDNLSHPGIPATPKLATLCLVSHQINRGIRKWVRTLMPPLSTRANSPCRIDRQPKHPHYHPIVLIMSPLTFLGVYYVHVVISVYSPPLTISPGGRQLSQFRTLLQRLARTLISEWVSRFDVLTIITTHCGCEF